MNDLICLSSDEPSAEGFVSLAEFLPKPVEKPELDASRMAAESSLMQPEFLELVRSTDLY